jgi:nicotinamide-nucleotide amidase
MNAEIVTIGTELLLGDIVDTNSAHIARTVRDIGLDLYYLTTVGDNVERTAAAVSGALDRADVVITTGGLGPTVDDVTRQAVAQATGRPLELRADLLGQISARYARWGAEMSPNSRQQAYVPAGAIGLENPVGTAPCFIVETGRGSVVSLPGVPKEMTYMLSSAVIPYLQEKMGAPAVILSRVLRTAGIGESAIDAAIQDLERLANPTVGLAAHAGQTDIRVAAKAATREEAEALIDPIVRDIRGRLGISVYGEGTETIEEAVFPLLVRRELTVAVAEAGTGGMTGERLSVSPRAAETLRQVFAGSDWPQLAAALDLPTDLDAPLTERAESAARQARLAARARLGLAVLAEREESGRSVIGFALSAPDARESQERGYGGPPEYLSTWASTRAIDRLRRWLLR